MQSEIRIGKEQGGRRVSFSRWCTLTHWRELTNYVPEKVQTVESRRFHAKFVPTPAEVLEALPKNFTGLPPQQATRYPTAL